MNYRKKKLKVLRKGLQTYIPNIIDSFVWHHIVENQCLLLEYINTSVVHYIDRDIGYKGKLVMVENIKESSCYL
jgi:hypothetical protein